VLPVEDGFAEIFESVQIWENRLSLNGRVFGAVDLEAVDLVRYSLVSHWDDLGSNKN